MDSALFDLKTPRQARSRATRSRFLDAAGRLLATTAIDALSIDDIVAEAELSVGAFYKHFATKSDIVAALVERLLAASAARQTQLLETRGELPERLRRLVRALAAGWQAEAPVIRAALTLHGTPHAQALRARAAEDQARIVAWLVQCREAFRPADPEAAIRACFALPLAALQQAMIAPGAPCDPGALTEAAADMMVAYLCRPAGAVPKRR